VNDSPLWEGTPYSRTQSTLAKLIDWEQIVSDGATVVQFPPDPPLKNIAPFSGWYFFAYRRPSLRTSDFRADRDSARLPLSPGLEGLYSAYKNSSFRSLTRKKMAHVETCGSEIRQAYHGRS